MTPVRRASRPARAARAVARGFTLVELLVALFALAILSGMAWQGLEAVLQAREASRSAVERAGRLATVLTQWEQDLQAVVDTGLVPPLQFDGQTVRLTRRSDAGVVIAAWAVRDGRWQRWTSPAFTRAEGLQQGWLASQQLQGGEPGQLTLVERAEDWQMYFFYDGNWANAQSTGDVVEVPQAAAPAPVPPSGAGTGAPGTPAGANNPAPAGPTPVLRQQLPAAVRIVVTLDGRTLTRDIALAAAGS